MYARIRVEEKMIVKELEKRGVNYDLIDVRKAAFDIHDNDWQRYDVILERCVSHSQALTVLRILGNWGIPCVNSARVAEVCGDKLLTSLALVRAGVATPRVKIAFTPNAALQAIEELGYPAVLKPARQAIVELLLETGLVQRVEARLLEKSIGDQISDRFR